MLCVSTDLHTYFVPLHSESNLLELFGSSESDLLELFGSLAAPSAQFI